ncbi:MAG: glycosyltransferase [Bryobacteraceae bacterium]|nr:glycosyltransferase [Bryobacteraceae bacterium]
MLIPVFNDWEAAGQVVSALDRQEGARNWSVLLLDDGSTEPAPAAFASGLRSLARVSVLRMRRNLGHQRSIAIGLTEAPKFAPSAVVVMDGDGEDAPEHVSLLVERWRQEPGRIVFAERRKRMESLSFRVMYHAYRLLHRLLTGISVRVGNFSVVPAAALPALAASPDLWNHYAAAVFRLRWPTATLPLDRGRRYAGQSKMNFAALWVHGLSAISVFADLAGARLMALAVSLLPVAAMVAWLWPAAAWSALVGAVLLCAQTAAFLLQTVSARSQMNFLPARDASFFAAGLTTLYQRPSTDGLEQLQAWLASPTPASN